MPCVKGHIVTVKINEENHLEEIYYYIWSFKSIKFDYVFPFLVGIIKMDHIV